MEQNAPYTMHTTLEPERKKPDIELLKLYAQEVNIAELLNEDELVEIGRKVVREAEEDDKTREEWFDKYNEALKIAKQTIEKKNYPFENAANIKLPLILQGCIMFNARIMPELIQNEKTVFIKVIGDADLELEQCAKRVSEHMSLQTLKISDNWVSDTDKMLMALPLIGTVFRKWCYDPIMRKPTSYILLPTEVIVNNDVSTVETAPRVTHLLRLRKNEIMESTRYGLFLDIQLLKLDDDRSDNENTREDVDKVLPSNQQDNVNYYAFYEQSRWLDLDHDGYEEPYVVTVYKKTSQVVRIVARYRERDFVYNSKNELIKINPLHYYTAHHFLPSPDGTFLGMGFGQILLQLNEACNSITNNLVDAGTMANIRGGMIGSDLRLPKGEMGWTVGEWKQVKTSPGQRISDSIFPLPISEPSQTLFALLQFLVEFGRQIANINDVLMGNPSSAQMPATSVVTLVEQGSKIFGSILNRLYDSLRKEFKVLFDLNKDYLPLYAQEDLMISDGFIKFEDYQKERYNILPIANPQMGTDATRLAKMQVLLQMAQDPLLNKEEIYHRYFDVLGIPNVDKLFTPKEQLAQPTPEAIMAEAEAELKKAQATEQRAKASSHLMNHELRAHELDHKKDELKLKEKELQIMAATGGGKLATDSANAIANLTKAQSVATIGATVKAEQVMDKESAKGKIPVDFSDIDKDLQQQDQNLLTNQPQQGNVSSDALSGGGAQPPQGAGQGEQQSGLPPEVEQQLQQISQQQQSEQ